MYKTLRTIHLLCGVFALPGLLMYGISAVQMAHSKWFVLRPSITERDVTLAPGANDPRQLARDMMTAGLIRGEIAAAQSTAAALTLRITVPGRVQEVRYTPASGTAHIRISTAGTMGMLNRLHHAAGLWPEHEPLWAWGAFVGLVSLACVALAATGLWMWWMRRQERTLGLILIGANVAFSAVMLCLMRSAGP